MSKLPRCICTRVLWFTIILGEAFPVIYNQALERFVWSLYCMMDDSCMPSAAFVYLFPFGGVRGELSAGCYSTGQPAAS